MNDSFRHSSVKRIGTIVIAVAIGFGVAKLNIGQPNLAAAQTAGTAPPRGEHSSEEEHAKHEAALRKVMTGTVDVFFDVTEVEAAKPPLSQVRFVDLVDVTGKELLRFEKGKEQWLIDPDAVITFRIGGEPLRTTKGK